MGLPEPRGSEEMPCGIDIWASWGPAAEVGSGSSEGSSTGAAQSGAAELRKEVCAPLPCCLPFSHEGLPLAKPKRTACCGPSFSHTPLTPGHLSNFFLCLSSLGSSTFYFLGVHHIPAFLSIVSPIACRKFLLLKILKVIFLN